VASGGDLALTDINIANGTVSSNRGGIYNRGATTWRVARGEAC